MIQQAQWTRAGIVALSLWLPLAVSSAEADDTASSIGDAMAAFLNEHLGETIGGGKSSHMATEALRMAGGEFVPGELGADAPAAGDLVWGNLVTVISSDPGNLSPNARCQSGDVIQFHSAKFGTAVLPEHFTAVVAAVDSDGRPSQIFSQNWNQNRTIQKLPIDPSTLTSGWMRIYRPIARIDREGEWKFTVVNNDPSNQTYELLEGVDSQGLFSMTEDNTTGSFRIHWLLTSAIVPNLLSSEGSSYFVETGKGFEIYRSEKGAAFRQLEQ